MRAEQSERIYFRLRKLEVQIRPVDEVPGELCAEFNSLLRQIEGGTGEDSMGLTVPEAGCETQILERNIRAALTHFNVVELGGGRRTVGFVR